MGAGHTGYPPGPSEALWPYPPTTTRSDPSIVTTPSIAEVKQQLAVSRGEPLHLLARVAAEQRNCDARRRSFDHPPHGPGGRPAFQRRYQLPAGVTVDHQIRRPLIAPLSTAPFLESRRRYSATPTTRTQRVDGRQPCAEAQNRRTQAQRPLHADHRPEQAHRESAPGPQSAGRHRVHADHPAPLAGGAISCTTVWPIDIEARLATPPMKSKITASR